MDAIEQRVHDLDSAHRVLDRHVPENFEWLRRWQRHSAERFEFADWVEQAHAAITICLARIALRNGSAAEFHRCFHDEQHLFDLLGRVDRLHCCAPLAFSDYIALALFCAGHDLRQDLSEPDGEGGSAGVGRNERASAAELERILEGVGLDSHGHAPMRAVVRQMIHGSAFHARAFVYRGRKYPGGALAPALVEELDNTPGAGGVFSSGRLELVLLAADIDTGNVADPFEIYIDRAVRLCRENFALRGSPELDTGTAVGVYRFLTEEQERYFFALQRFHSGAAKACFQADKEANGVKLKALTAAMRARYESLLADAVPDISGERVIADCLELARTVPGGEPA